MRCGCRLVNIRRRNKQMKAFIHADLYGRKEDAFLIDGERFCRFGTSEEIEAQLAAEDELTDLHGAFVSPGFHDSHCHLSSLAGIWKMFRCIPAGVRKKCAGCCHGV